LEQVMFQVAEERRPSGQLLHVMFHVARRIGPGRPATGTVGAPQRARRCDEAACALIATEDRRSAPVSLHSSVPEALVTRYDAAPSLMVKPMAMG
jgi:hypothetical protein